MKIKRYIFLIPALFVNILFAKEFTGREANQKIQGAEKIITGTKSDIPEFIQLRPESNVSISTFSAWAHRTFSLPSGYDFKLLNSQKDAIGMTHYRYQQTFNQIPLEGTMFIVHEKSNLVVSMNGILFNKINTPTIPVLGEQPALTQALAYMNADLYRWQVAGEEEQLKRVTNNSTATWFPKGDLMLAPVNGNLSAASYRLAYRFDVYAEKPLKREYVFVDASTGEILYSLNRIQHASSNATALTAYSGSRPIVTDSVNTTTFHLRDNTRGNGVETYNLLQGTNYTNTDFVDADNFWNNVNAAQDQYAGDAHWGAEMTYDFYMAKFGRNSVDDNGKQLLSYVHYDVNYVNAFWDGDEMTYGDGGGGYTPLTSLDVTGHEISHGVTEFTSNLNYANESGAMNEAFSDCMGNAIRYFGKQPSSIDWLIGDEIGGTPFRNMANPNQYQNPDCYNGLYWNAPNEVHNNSGVMNFWFYLLTEGGNGTNDLGNAYNISGLGINKAAAICYRMNAIYLTPSSEYADARTYAIQAATDLYGACTNEVIQTANAWHAVGVGGIFSPVVVSDFTSPVTSFCAVPALVSFTNQSINGGTFTWNFGDASPLSNAASPTHSYAANGIYTVSLIADGGTCGIDTAVYTAYINVDSPTPPVSTGVSVCPGNSASLSASGATVYSWHSTPTGGVALDSGAVFNTPPISSATTYYVEADVVHPLQYAQPFNNTFGGGGYFANSNYHDLVFDCYSPVKLISVLVYAQTAGSRTITLTQNSVVIQSATVNIPSGSSRVTLNFNVPVGTALELGCGDDVTAVNLYRNNSGAAFPYTLNGIISITGTNAGSSGYYYFYDWELQQPPCVSARTPVQVSLFPVPLVAFTYDDAGLSVNFTDFSSVSPGAIVAWSWNFGDPVSGANNVSAIENPFHQFSLQGDYTVCLTVTDSNGCSTTYCKPVNVTNVGIAGISGDAGVSVFPNPVTDQLGINFSAAFQGNTCSVKLYDVIGKIVAEKIIAGVQPSQNYLLDASALAPGAYMLTIESNDHKIMKRIIRQ
jgi:Zn-dependent metalloprotease